MGTGATNDDIIQTSSFTSPTAMAGPYSENLCGNNFWILKSIKSVFSC